METDLRGEVGFERLYLNSKQSLFTFCQLFVYIYVYLALLVTLGFEDMEVVKSSIDIEFCLDSGVVHLEPPEGPILDLGRRSQDESWNCC